MVGKSASSSKRSGGSRVERLLEVLQPRHWRLRRLESLGKGGFGSIQVAVDRVLQRRMAVKVVNSELQDDELTLQLFAREAMITAQLDHPNIVPVHDVGCDDDDRLFFTMKLIEGQSLAEIIEGTKVLDWHTLREGIEIVIKLCDALAFAHSRGVLHCDVKPANVMVGDFGQVYLMDWGAACLLEDSELSLDGPLREAVGMDDALPRHHQAVLGTPAYMSPEQAAGNRDELDPRVDVFSLGAVLYELVTGRPPHESALGEAGPQLSKPAIEIARRGQIKPPSERTDRYVPLELERIILKALATDRDNRYDTVAKLRGALIAFARGDSGFPKVRYSTGEPIIEEGKAGDAAYILVEGRCEVFQTVDGKRRSLRIMGPGEVFGEAAVLSPGPRTASVVAIEPVELLVIDRAELHAEVNALKPWLARVLETLAARFRDAESARVSAERELRPARDSH